jgi:hypothetical protein
VQHSSCFSRQSKLFDEQLEFDHIYEPVGLKEGEQRYAELRRVNDPKVSIQNLSEVDHVVPSWTLAEVDVMKQRN